MTWGEIQVCVNCQERRHHRGKNNYQKEMDFQNQTNGILEINLLAYLLNLQGC
jgi:hypothetical protein